MRLLLVGLGGGLGSIARYLVGLGVAAAWPAAGPVATALVNVIGCGAIGVLAAVLEQRAAWLTADAWLVLAVGFLGGFTTFSAFGLDTVRLLDASPRLAVANASLQVILGIGAVAGARATVRALLSSVGS